jgi:hypothetical protein
LPPLCCCTTLIWIAQTFEPLKGMPLINCHLWVWLKLANSWKVWTWLAWPLYVLPLITRIFFWLAGSLSDLPLVRGALNPFAFDQTLVVISLMPSIDLQVKLFLFEK